MNQSALVLVVDGEHKVLTVTNRKYGCVALPGGKREPGEGIKGCAVRELREEIGSHTTESELVLIARGIWRDEREVFVFWVHTIKGTPSACEPGTEIKWLTFDELCAGSVFANFYKKHLLPFEVLVPTVIQRVR